ncbi:MAG: hypothetical protein BEU05_03440 [Marine Group III euryarchaeote CG-Bathy2]|uniref:Sec-independent protein translocase protein TatA n=2 Tax=Methanobacteriati TaxID=3366610 RepID=A0A075GNB0_9EURY|nr:hypothetical protein [uncultured marine group II/III euryarchaeote KM3_164_G07]OIR11987.1 MAG: hypothetical protein BEU05_03440 [Marine Group III euryarchaeote CG-Bathy2]
MLGTTEALIIGGIILLLFGAKKLPELAKSLGQSKAAFDEGVAEGAPAAEDSGEDKVEEPDSEDDDEGDGGDSGGGHDDSIHSNFGGGFG